MDTVLPLSEITIRDIENSWLRIFTSRESGVVFWPLHGDRVYRLEHFLSQHIDIFPIQLSQLQIEDATDIEHFLATHKPYKNYIILDGERLFRDLAHLLPVLEQKAIRHQMSFLIFSECRHIPATPHVFLANMVFQPLYSPADTLQFVAYLEKKFNTQVNPEFQKKMGKASGGHLWLLKEMVRARVLGIDDPFDHESLWFRVQAIWDGLTEDEKQVVRQIHQGIPVTHTDSLNYLEKIGFIRDTKLSIGLLDEYLERYVFHQATLSVQSGKLYLEDVCIDSFFTYIERLALSHLVSANGSVVSRESLGEVIWKHNSYTNWALDQVVRRLRIKLQKIHERQFIYTKKRRGVLCQKITNGKTSKIELFTDPFRRLSINCFHMRQ